jgi:hypothetical protein
MIYKHELKAAKGLHPLMRAQLLLAAISIEAGAIVHVHATAPKVTDTPARVGGGQDFLTIPGISPDAQIGPMTLHRYVDNADNRRQDRVNEIYLKIRSITRANGFDPFGFTNLRLSQLTGFVVVGVETPEPEMATAALAQAAQAQAPKVGA